MNFKDFNWKKLLQLIGIEYAAFVSFFFVIFVLTQTLTKYLPKNPFDPNALNGMSSLELQIINDQMKSFAIAYFTLLIILIFLALLIYNLSRKLIWEKLIHDKYSLKQFWKYFGFNSAVTISIFVSMTLIYLLWEFITSKLVYLLSFIPDLIRNLLTVIFVIILLFYGSIILTYAANYYYLNNKNEYKSLKNLKNLKLKKYIWLVSGIFITLYLINFLLLLFPNQKIIYVIGLLAYATHNVALKYLVVSRENYKKKSIKKSK